jgi:VanZ family protein
MLLGLATLAYLGLILYGSLFPFTGWHEPGKPTLSYLTGPLALPANLSRTDVIINVLVYIPLGFLFAFSARKWLGLAGAAIMAVAIGAALSFSVETMQVFLPGRVASRIDLATNIFGTCVGALGAWLLQAMPTRRLWSLREQWLVSGRHAEFGVVVLLLGLLSMLSPLYPALGEIRVERSIVPLWQVVVDAPGVNPIAVGLYVLSVAGLGMMAALLVRPEKTWFRVYVLLVFSMLAFKFAASVLLFKVPFWEWRLSLKAVLGLLGGFGVLALLPGLRRTYLTVGAVAMIAAVHVVGQVLPGNGEDAHVTHPFNWIPFKVQMQGLTGILDVAASAIPFLIMGYLVSGLVPRYRRVPAMFAGAAIVFVPALGLEFYQQYVPGRTPDITDALLALVGWFGGWLVKTEIKRRPGMEQSVLETGRRSLKWWLVSVTLAGAALGAVSLIDKPAERPLNEKYMKELPAPETLPPVALPRFHFAHPRLPAPSPGDMARLERENPGYFGSQERGLAQRAGNIFARIRLARAFPGSQDLNGIFRDLMALEFTHRGHDQAKPLAMGYDWLYDQWSDAQRAALRDKLAEGCRYVINVIRHDRLSPYNVYLYNSPLQGLMAMSLALYGDDPRGEPVMRFTYDLWKNQVLPVWRQVMGRNGGWHEGGEYVAVGIGQAIFELPNMWRSGTGEDLFKSEPGIRGFLDFLVYRIRPDGTCFHWGDAGYFNRPVLDMTPLALEYHDAAAYGLSNPPRGVVPTSWPWGPLADPALLDPLALSTLPLTKYFDGIGMLVARSGWGPDATYVTFKTGDNYWSHSHLDQGAFTIYKGGALAIDSGVYGPKYGADHHMNYTYQTIAHNTVTVTDPDDTVPARNKKGESREIANDGGQRRIGSGWGVEPAPLNLAEWQAKREIYHTGTMEKVFEGDGISVAVADVTPAYTNKYSGEGTFSHRTRRVERFWRVFAYDRVDDVVVVFDQVRATKPEFRKRWLLHTQEKPRISSHGFTVDVAPTGHQGHAGGQLTGRVLLPEGANLEAIGGRGFEFFVDGRNYDENGGLSKVIHGKHDLEPGAWRVEVSPPTAARDDQFLVVLLPSSGSQAPPHQVHLLKEAGRVGCEVVGPTRTTRWWFEPGRNGVRVEIRGAPGPTVYNVAARS